MPGFQLASIGTLPFHHNIAGECVIHLLSEFKIRTRLLGAACVVVATFVVMIVVVIAEVDAFLKFFDVFENSWKNLTLRNSFVQFARIQCYRNMSSFLSY